MNKDNFNDDLLQEECKIINENLKKAEKIDLPESLNPQNIADKLDFIKQDKPQEPKVISSNGKKRRIKRYIISSVATAAAFIIAVTSVMVIKPWEKDPVKPVVPTNPEVSVEDYTEIENMFSDYSDKYQKYLMKQGVDDAFDFFAGGIFGYKAESEIITDDALVMNGAATDTAAPQAGANSGVVQNTTANKEFGKTNEQVEGVSEADIIKNDGKYLYVVEPSNADWAAFWGVVNGESEENLEETTASDDAQSTPGYNPQEEIITETTEKVVLEKNSKGQPILPYNCSVAVIEPDANGNMKKIASINVAKPENEDIYYMEIAEMYVKGNDLIIIATCNEFDDVPENHYKYYDMMYYGAYDKDVTMAACFDISQKDAPVEKWRFYQDGDYISSRLIGNQFVVLSSYYVDITGDKEDVVSDCIPTFACGDNEMARISAGDVCVMEEITDTSYLFATTLDINDESSVKNQAVLGAGSDVYCTTENLYAVSARYKNEGIVGEVFGVTTYTTKIYKFDIRNYNISYLGCGEVDGFTLNQFSIDEYNGYLRIATSTGSWGENISNKVYVLDSDLKVVGKIEGIAKGETIKSVRFTGDTGYVVTFEQTDPLFVIDLSNPEKPEIKGELKIPGFSTYLHPVGENLVLGVGVDGDENGQNNGLKVSLFDVSDPANPIESHKVTIPANNKDGSYTYVTSQAYNTHKALCWDDNTNTMYIPYLKRTEVWYHTDDYSFKNVSGILAVKVNEEEKTLEKSQNYTNVSDSNKTDWGFERTTYIGDVIFGYSHSGNVIMSFDKTTRKQLNTLNIN